MRPEKNYLSQFALGLWRLRDAQLSDDEVYELIQTCLDNGITTFDHADIYGKGEAQMQFGRVLKDHPELRKKMVIVSKCSIVRPEQPTTYLPSYYNTSREHIFKSVDQTLHDLHIETLDVLLIHRVDFLMDYKEVADTFRELREQNKVKYFGVSNFLVPQLDAILKEFPDIFVNQIQISVDHLEHFKNGVLERCAYYDLDVMAYSPLGGGAVFKDGYKNEYLKTQITNVQNEVTAPSPDTVMLSWLLKHPLNIKIILGSMKKERILSQIKSKEIHLTNEQWYNLFTASQLERVP